MNGTTSQRITSAIAVAVAGVAILLWGTGGAQAQAGGDTLPPVTLPALTVQAGTTANYTLPCAIKGGDYGRLGIDLHSGSGDGPYLVVASRFGQESSFEQGDVVPLEVPATVPPGEYQALVSCFITEESVQASFVQTVTINPASATSTRSSPSNTSAAKAGDGAAAATPVRATAAYTG